MLFIPFHSSSSSCYSSPVTGARAAGEWAGWRVDEEANRRSLKSHVGNGGGKLWADNMTCKIIQFKNVLCCAPPSPPSPTDDEEPL